MGDLLGLANEMPITLAFTIEGDLCGGRVARRARHARTRAHALTGAQSAVDLLPCFGASLRAGRLARFQNQVRNRINVL